jgi:phytoene synthase
MIIAPTSHAATTLRRNGRSFWFASLFLPSQVAADAARLYAFCRAMDDLADIAVTPESRAALDQVRADLQRGTSSIPDVQDLLALATQYNLPRDAADYLIATFIEDAATELHIEDEDHLVRYCYGVAGTVGLMMSPILGAPPQAGQAAMHLGIAMQMTNIARDVLEDATNHRRYLPGCWVQHLTAQQILHASQTRAQSPHAPETQQLVASAVLRLLALADRYYASASLGFPSIPIRARRGIEIAAAVYREIGTVLRRNHGAWWNGRTLVSTSRKLSLAAQVYLGQSPVLRLPPIDPGNALSHPLLNLPGVMPGVTPGVLSGEPSGAS